MTLKHHTCQQVLNSVPDQQANEYVLTYYKAAVSMETERLQKLCLRPECIERPRNKGLFRFRIIGFRA